MGSRNLFRRDALILGFLQNGPAAHRDTGTQLIQDADRADRRSDAPLADDNRQDRDNFAAKVSLSLADGADISDSAGSLPKRFRLIPDIIRLDGEHYCAGITLQLVRPDIRQSCIRLALVRLRASQSPNARITMAMMSPAIAPRRPPSDPGSVTRSTFLTPDAVRPIPCASCEQPACPEHACRWSARQSAGIAILRREGRSKPRWDSRRRQLSRWHLRPA